MAQDLPAGLKTAIELRSSLARSRVEEIRSAMLTNTFFPSSDAVNIGTGHHAPSGEMSKAGNRVDDGRFDVSVTTANGR